MNQWIDQIWKRASAAERTVLGAISGTSMDGVDLALCRIRGAGSQTELDILHYAEKEIPPQVLLPLREAAFLPTTTVETMVGLEVQLSRAWSHLITETLNDWDVDPSTVDLIGSHGQTLFHRPDREGDTDATIQLVDGDRLTRATGIPVIHDFRQAMIAAGTEGAPLAPLGESLLYRHSTEPRILLNLGGIGNVTLLPAGEIGSGAAPIPFATDTGPANTLIDEAVRRLYPGRSYDKDGALARRGTVIPALLERLEAHPFFTEPTPKSTGQEQFHWSWVHQNVLELSLDPATHDLLATLTELTARTVLLTIPSDWRRRVKDLYIGGGGWKNRYLIERLEANWPGVRCKSIQEAGVEPESKEAALFALLANERISGPGWVTSEGVHVTPGKISLP
ncbi:MAG: anhydro-N-acetylmuramic acid kinase [Balneolaceae bacterium]